MKYFGLTQNITFILFAGVIPTRFVLAFVAGKDYRGDSVK